MFHLARGTVKDGPRKDKGFRGEVAAHAPDALNFNPEENEKSNFALWWSISGPITPRVALSSHSKSCFLGCQKKLGFKFCLYMW